MKKNLFMLAAVLFGVSLAGAAQASPANSNFVITNMSSSEKGIYREADTNPTSYSKKEINGHIYESWVDNNTAYTKVDGNLTKEYKIDNDLQRPPINNMSSNKR
ncbi:hypothetical protein [Pectinatus haikarae]|uniref:Uncharacterized protein n=1 Tax=Pectinatus haikarae TaxID=349096 RepID=A0ABT9Y9Z1_9FIRM|nr:hypothetical protein [Pectinatus haikarae]MDQ0203924.1 hypothetical protein [Pectinatus haikarae]